jgi:hypothetical protein
MHHDIVFMNVSVLRLASFLGGHYAKHRENRFS